MRSNGWRMVEIMNELIAAASALCNPRKIGIETLVGEVGAALLTESGKIYTGISIAAPCGLGFCAEHSAIAEMLKNGEEKIKMIVAVNVSGIIPPCGRCRELIRQINDYNYANTMIVLGRNEAVHLSDLLPVPF